MNFGMNLEPHIAALLFLGSLGLLLLLLMATVVLLFWRRKWVKFSLASIAGLVLGYAVLLLMFSAFSRDHTLARGEEKYFCELDCHLAYSVQKVERLKTIGDATAAGDFYVVTIRIRFDENTIAPWRGRELPYIPSPMNIAIVGEHGRAFSRSQAGQQAWDAVHGGPKSMLDCLRPGESYDRTLVFDVPPEARSPRLQLVVSEFPHPVLIGNEGSFGHRKTYFAL